MKISPGDEFTWPKLVDPKLQSFASLSNSPSPDSWSLIAWRWEPARLWKRTKREVSSRSNDPLQIAANSNERQDQINAQQQLNRGFLGESPPPPPTLQHWQHRHHLQHWQCNKGFLRHFVSKPLMAPIESDHNAYRLQIWLRTAIKTAGLSCALGIYLLPNILVLWPNG